MEQRKKRGRPPLLDEASMAALSGIKPGTRRTAQNAYYGRRAMALLESHRSTVPHGEYLLTGGKGRLPRECVLTELGRMLLLIETHVSEIFAERCVLGLMKEICARGVEEHLTTRQAEAIAHARRMEFAARFKRNL